MKQVIIFFFVAACLFGGPASANPGAALSRSADQIMRASSITGGVAVHLGCGDGKLTAAFHKDERLLVHGLDTDAANVKKAKAYIDALGIYGKVWAEQFDGKNLPYGDNMVNLIVVDDQGGACQVSSDEILRVLAPRGVVLFKASNRMNAEYRTLDLQTLPDLEGWLKYTKPVPAEIDEWTHFLYDASGNAVSKDRKVRRPHHLQWYAGPRRARHHDALASLSAMTSSGGRVFYIFDEGPTSLMHRPASWKLIARDAFNGKLIWKRDIPQWMTHLHYFRTGPAELPRRLVSIEEHVFVTLGLCAPVTKLDGASGKTLLTYAGSENTEEIIYHNGMLLTVIGDPSFHLRKTYDAFGYWELSVTEDPVADKSIVAYDADSGSKLWTIASKNLQHLVPLSLCAFGDRVFYLDNDNLHCADAATGRQLWSSPLETEGLFIRAYTPTVVAQADVIMCLEWNRIRGYDTRTGKIRWENKGAMGFAAAADLLVMDGKAWTLPMIKAVWNGSRTNREGIVTTGIPVPRTNFLDQGRGAVALDLQTGEIIDRLPFQRTQHHHRCYRNKATPDYILIGHSGIQVADLKNRTTETHRWVRGLCQYGIMPANGYIYVPPDTCQCYSGGKINGFFALSENNSWADVEVTPVLEKGPAYGRTSTDAADNAPWPTYRGDNIRSGSTTANAFPLSPRTKWTASIGPDITAPVVAENKVFVADREGCSVHCLDQETGTLLWKHLANGPIDSPPTIYRGLCIFGCGDGSVYCVSTASGELVWRFKTSATERRVGWEDHLESPLRISGSTLVLDGTVYFAAGYSSNLDGGIRLFGVDALTGELCYSTTVASNYWGDEPGWGALADVLSSDGNVLNMRNLTFDKQLNRAKPGRVILSTKSILEDAWFHRQDWASPIGGKGQLVVFNDVRSLSVVNPYTGLKQQRQGKYKEFNQVGHLHQKFARYEEEFFPTNTTIICRADSIEKSPLGTPRGKEKWSIEVPFQPRAMVLAGDNVFTAGWVDAVVIEPVTGYAKDPDNPDPRDSYLRIYSAADGEQLADIQLDAEPVFDGIAVAPGQLFISLKNGTLVCMASVLSK